MITKKRALLCYTTAVMALFASEPSETLELANAESANQSAQEILLVKENASKGENSSLPSSKQHMPMINGNSSVTKVSGSADCKIGLDFLYWKRTSGQIFIGDGIGVSFADGETLYNETTRGKSYLAEYSYEPGVRALLGIDFQRDGWDLEATYNWIKWNSTVNYKPTGAGWAQVFDYFQDTNVTTSVTGASNQAHMTLNLAYLTLGRKFYTSEWMLMRPNMGLAFTYIPHNRTVTYNYFLAGSTTEARTETYHNSGNGFGAGMVLGLDTEWRFHPDWSFLGNISFASLYTGYIDNSKETELNRATNVSTQNLLSSTSPSAMQFIPSLFIGIDWHTSFYKNNYVCLHAGWDFLSGFQNFAGTAIANTLHDDYGMQGFQLGGMVQF